MKRAVVFTFFNFRFAWKFNIWTGSTQEHSGTKYKTDKIVFHPKYNNITRNYNLALVRISGSGIKFSEKVMSIEIAARPLKLGQVAITSGWGYVSILDCGLYHA